MSDAPFGETPQEQQALQAVYQNAADGWLKGYGDAVAVAVGLTPPVPTSTAAPATTQKDSEVSPNDRAAEEWPSIEYHTALLLSEITGINDLATVRALLSTHDGKAILAREKRAFEDKKDEERRQAAEAKSVNAEKRKALEALQAQWQDTEKRYQEMQSREEKPKAKPELTAHDAMMKIARGF